MRRAELTTLEPEMPGDSVTRVELLERKLSESIVSGAILPGSPLDETEIARAFGVSRTPVREALRILAASGLVRHTRHIGAVVARPSDEELWGMFFVMGELEALCVSLAAAEMTSAERNGIERLHMSMAELVRGGDILGYAAANGEFHGHIYRGSHNSYLAEITAQTRKRLAPFRRAQISNIGRLANSHAEHSAILTALLRGDATSAAALMRDHLSLVGESFIENRA